MNKASATNCPVTSPGGNASWLCHVRLQECPGRFARCASDKVPARRVPAWRIPRIAGLPPLRRRDLPVSRICTETR
jgi:hypothetical protein